MEIKTLQAHYRLVEFYHYITQVDDDKIINVLEMTADIDGLDYVEDEFTNVFAIQSEDQCYVFSHYEVSEYYEDENGLVKIVCVK